MAALDTRVMRQAWSGIEAFATAEPSGILK
jgi:hypothetical protein